MNNILNTFVILLLLAIQFPAYAIDGVFVSLGAGMNDSLIQSSDTTGASQVSIGVTWLSESHFSHDLVGYSELSWEAYFSHLNNPQTINLMALRPIFTFWESPEKTRRWYWQAGVGLAYLDNKELASVYLSSNAQFASVLGIGIKLDEEAHHMLTLRYNHYSNANIKRPNPGLDMVSVDWQYNF